MAGGRGISGITVIAGPARSGKTALVVSSVADSIRERKKPLVILPHEDACAAFRRLLLNTLEAIETDVTVTFASLSSRLVAASGDTRQASAYQREIILRDVVSRLDKAGKIAHFRPIIDLPGFYDKLEELILELESGLIGPDRIKKKDKPRNARDEEIALIYKGYLDGLSGRNLADAQGLVAEAVKATPRCGWHRLDGPVFVDGFVSFSENELSLLGAIASRGAALTITLPYDELRAELFEQSKDTLARLSRRFTVKVAHPSGTAENRIAFRFMGERGKEPSRGALKVISTAGTRMEMEEIAREAKRLIREGRSPQDIVVVVRNAAEVIDLAKDVFSRMGVPLEAGASLAPASSPVFGLLRMLVEVVESDFGRAETVALFASSYVDLRRLAGGTLTGGDVTRIARAAGIIKGTEQWRSRLAALATQIEAETQDDDYADEEEELIPQLDVTRIAFLRTAFDQLEERLRALRGAVPPGVMAGRMRWVIDVLGLRGRILQPGVPEDVIFRDVAAFAALTEALDFLEASPREGGAVTARGFLDIVATAARATRVRSGELETSGVKLIEAKNAANLAFPVVFLCGVSAEAYPKRLEAGPFYSREEREELAEQGVFAEGEKLHMAAERLLFYTIATRATETLYVTYPATDDDGRPKIASFYVDELLEIFELEKADRRDYGPSRAIKGLDEAASADEVALAAGDGIRRAESPAEAVGFMRVGVAAHSGFVRALRGATVEARREALVGFDSFDAMLSQTAAALVAGRFRPGRPWSGTQLSEYGACPSRFYLSRVLCVSRPEEPDIVPSALERGDLAHRILARFFTKLRDEGCLGFERGEKAKCDEIFAAISNEICAAYERRFGISDDPFWRIERQRIKAMVARFVDAELERLAKAVEKGKGYTPAFFELAFGLDDGDESDKASSTKPVEVRIDKRTERLRGRIDRVDFAGGAGEAAIVDYKHSGTPSKADVEAYIDMQMAAYVYAAPALAGGRGVLFPAEAFFRSIRGATVSPRPVLTFKERADYEAFRRAFAQALMERADRIRSGRFAATPAAACADYCIGRGVCRYSQTRVEFLEKRNG